MKSQHYTTFAVLAAALGAMVIGLPNWHAALTPSFIGGALVALAAVVKAMYQGAPNNAA